MRTIKSAIGQSFLLALLVVITVSGILIFNATRVDEEAFKEAYNARSEASKVERVRAEPTPGWALVEGSAAEAYQAAYQEGHGACNLSLKDDVAIEAALQRTLGAMMAPRAPVEAPDAWAPPADCAALGVRAAQYDPVVSQLNEGLCSRIKSCERAFGLVDEGARRTVSDSPVSIWSPWAMTTEHKLRSLKPFLTLLKLNLVYLHLRALDDTSPEAHLDKLMALMRFSNDLGQGGGLAAALWSAKLLHQSTGVLERFVALHIDDIQLVERTRRELGYLNQSPLSFRATLDAEYLATMSQWANIEGLDTPTTSLAATPPTNPVEVLLDQNLLKEQSALFEDYFRASGLSGVARQKSYDELDKAQTRDFNPLVRLTAVNYGKHDPPVSMAVTRLHLLEMMTAAVVYRAAHRKLPNSIAQIETILGRPAPQDPLVGGAYMLENTLEGIKLSSRALETAQSNALGIIHKHQRDGLSFDLVAPPKVTP